MAEVENPGKATDWTFADRDRFTNRWNDANCFCLLAGTPEEYKTIRQRAYFYTWFDQIREVQGHEILWPAAAWIVATQMSNVENPVKSLLISNRMIEFAKAGNKAIFDDVFPKLSEVYQRGLNGRPLRGEEARNWDIETLRHEQFDVVDPIYKEFTRADPELIEEMTALAKGEGVFAMGGVAIAGALDFTGDILKPTDRFRHGDVVVTRFYQRFKAAISAARTRRQSVRPDPTARGRISTAATRLSKDNKATSR